MKKSKLIRFAKFAVILAVAVFGVGLTTAHADSFTTVVVTGSFAGGTSFAPGSTITIDTTTGTITAANLTTTGGVSFSFSCSGGCAGLDQGGDGPNGYMVNFTSGGVTVSLLFFTADGTLINYSGGIFCTGDSSGSNPNGCGDPSEIFGDGIPTAGLIAGSVSAVPEPATYLLLGSGLIGLGLLGRKRLVTNA